MNRNKDVAVGNSETFFIRDLSIINIGICFYILAGPVVHGHYFTLLMPSIIQSMRHANKLYLKSIFPFISWSVLIGLFSLVFLSLHPVLVWFGFSGYWENDMYSYFATILLLCSLVKDFRLSVNPVI